MPERLSRKLGPLPVYAWALIAVGAFLLYRRYKGNAATGSAGSSPTGANPVPFGDQASFGSGGIGNAQVPDAVQTVTQPGADGAQASGGGTTSDNSTGATTPTSSDSVTTPPPPPTAPSYTRPVYLAPATTAAGAAVQAQTSTTTSGRPTKVGGAYHPGQGFD